MDNSADIAATNAPSPIRIVFMGTPEFAVASLRALVMAGYNVVGVITAPDKPAGRGMKLTESAVKTYAVESGIPVLQPEKLKNPLFLEELRQLHADVQVVVAFRMLPEVVWNMPKMGTINVHGSMLPQYRGAAPLNWAIINGEKETGVTTFLLQQEIDTGSILLSSKLVIGENETAGELHDRMKEAGALILLDTLKALSNGTLEAQPQPAVPEDELKHAPKIMADTGQIDWAKPLSTVHNLIRGLSPVPAAYTRMDGKLLKITRSAKDVKSVDVLPGSYETDHATFLRFACADGYIRVLELQLEGKKRMPIADFLRGYRFK